MNPDSYMPFFWPAFWEAVKSWPDCAIVGYQKGLTHYWFHLHCVGLPDDAEKLRRICEREKSDWPACCDLIFDNDKFFKLDEKSGLWKQKRADEEWLKCKKIMEFNHKRAVAGGQANRKAWNTKLEA